MGRDVGKPNDKLRLERESRHWTQGDVAEKLGTTDVAVSRWERGVQRPGPHFRGKLCELFEKSTEELGLSPAPPSPQESEEIGAPAPIDVSPDADAQLGEVKFPIATNVQGSEATEIPRSTDPLPRSTDPLPSASEEPSEAPTSIPTSNSQTLSEPRPITKQQDKNRERMLGLLRSTYQKLLEHSLQGAIRLELGLAVLPDAVQNATNLLLYRTDQSEQQLPPGTSLLDIYEEAQHELLILGAPGAGKSTLLQELALKLVEQAEQDEKQRLPVILPLSSWAQTRPPLEDWLSAQLSQIYDVPEKLVQRWVREERWLFLLDGLDEMEAAARPDCIAAINAYHHTYFVPLVVCSRHADYEQAAKQERLSLQSALLIQPLSQGQVEEYLRSTGMYGETLSHAMQDDPELQKLFTTPLMLNILTLAYRGESVEELLRETSLYERQRKLFAHYVKRMLARRGPLAPWTGEQCMQWLGYLARQLRADSQTIFYLEHLQSDWLAPRLRRTYHWLGIGLPAIVMGVLAGLTLFLFLNLFLNSSSDLTAFLTSLLPVALLGGLLGGLFCQTYDAEKNSSSLSLGLVPVMSPRPLLYMLFSLGVGLVCACCCSSDPDAHLMDWLVGGSLVGGAIGLGCFVLLMLFSLSAQKLSRHPVLNFWRANRLLLVALILGLSSGLGKGLSLWLTSGMIWGLNDLLSFEVAGPFQLDWLGNGLFWGLSHVLSSALLFGFICAITEQAVSAHVGEFRLIERMRWTWYSLLTSLGALYHLGTTLWLGALVALLSGLSAGLAAAWNQGLGVILPVGLNAGLSFGLSVALSYWFLLGLWSGIAQERLDDQQRQVPNQGVRRCLWNSLIMGIISGVLISVVSILLRIALPSALSALPSNVRIVIPDPLSQGLINALLVAVTSGCFVWLLSGGWTVLRHYLLRRLLARHRVFPWRAQSFLDDMTARLLLRRVGGGYIFVHRLLLEYFAELEGQEPGY